jgi:3-deoxy-7-phosphoheptulonate synthase
MTNSDKLNALRAEIDSLDDQILALIERRVAASAAISAAKGNGEDGRLKLRPRRQAEVIARLQGRASHTPADAVAAIWRELMGYTLQAQARTEIVLAAPEASDLLEAQVRAHFGSGFPVRRVGDRAEALRCARDEEAIAILGNPLAAGEADGLLVFDIVRGADGAPAGYAIGRIAPGDTVETADGERPEWSPGSWRARPAAQMPAYPSTAALARVEQKLSAARPLVPFSEVRELRARLARVAAGEAFLVQGGDCAESFAEFSPEKVRRDEQLLLGLGHVIGAETPVVHVARAAGQFAKPRSAGTETEDGVTLPSYRGDAVNARGFDPESRTPDAERLIAVYGQSRATLALLNAYRAAEPGRERLYVSHEALLLPYEQALTRRDASGLHWAGSGHMVWIGERTRALGGAHLEYARGIANPIGVKCGPGMSPDDLLRLIDLLDPQNVPGRLVLIGRFGAARIGSALPSLMQATRRAGSHAIWASDPMHGNGIAVNGIKTRRLADILDEVRSFFAIAASENVHAGGIHLEMSGSDVTECLGGRLCGGSDALGRRYLSHCDPRLNPAQALELAGEVAALIGRGAERRSDAA